MFAPSSAGTHNMFGLAPPKADSMPKVWSTEGEVILQPDMSPSDSSGRQVARWSPYVLNGGTALGIAGDDFAVLAADTRLSEGYSILSRDVGKGKALTPKCVIATGGCWTDVSTLHKVLQSRIETYHHQNNEEMSTPALAQALSTTLYSRRFFPYYAFNVVGGLDQNGKGIIYTYDAVGSYEKVNYAAQGAGQKLIIPLLDNIVGGKNRATPPPKLTVDAAIDLVKDAFVTAGERDIHTGDAVEIFIVTKAGVKVERFELKKD